MKYFMKGGNLFTAENKDLKARLKNMLLGSEKQVLLPDGSSALRVFIRHLTHPPVSLGDVRFSEYVIADPAGHEIGIAHPDYADGDDPSITGWPMSRMPLVDHASVRLGDDDFLLRMQSRKHYYLSDSQDKTVVDITHRGISGGWFIEAENRFSPVLLCGLFSFCRYIEQENEFTTV